MRRAAVLFAIFLGLSTSALAKSYEKSYIMNIHQEGKLYFIYETEMSSCEGKRMKSLRYDYTHIDSHDKVSMLATCSTDRAVKVDSLYVTLPSGAKCGYKVESIYNEADRKGWHHRFRCEIERDVWFDLYKTEQPFIIELQLTDGTIILYKDSERQWQKNRDKMLFIQEVILLNKE